MATTFVSAGVYISETDGSVYSPATSPTSIGIVGTATKGPTDTVTLIRTESDLITLFGVPRTKDFGMLVALETLKAARSLYFVRIAGAAAAVGLVNVLDAGSGATAASIGPSANAEPFDLLAASTESPVGTRTTQINILYENGGGPQDDTITFVGKQASSNNSPGAATYDLNGIDSGNDTFLTVRLDGGPAQTITFSSSDPLISAYNAVTPSEAAAVINDQIVGGEARISTNTVIIASDTFGSDSTVQVTGGNANTVFTFPTTLQTTSGNHVADLSAVLGTEIKTRIEAFTSGDLTVTVGAGGIVTIATTDTGSDKTIEIDSSDSPMVGASPLVNLTPLDTEVAGTDSSAAANTIRFSSKTKGSHSSDIQVRISDDPSLDDTKKIEVLYRGVTVETFVKAFKSPTPVTGGQDMVDLINDGASDNSQGASDYITATDLNASGENPANGTYTLSAGNDGDNWSASTVIGTDIGGVQTGMQLFADPETIFVNVLATPGISYASVISEGITICQNRGDCIFIADCPSGLSPSNVTGWHNGDSSITVTVDQEDRTETNATAFNSSYAALYYPFVTIYDKFNDENVSVPPSAVVLRTIAYTDQIADPWFVPGGPNRTQGQSVRDLEFSPSLADRDLLQTVGNNVNPIANLAGRGITIMGEKTLLRTPSSLDRVHARRLLLFAEKVVAQSVTNLMFEPNDDRMWRRFINQVSPIFDDIKARRGIYQFRVIADSSTNGETQINNNTFVGKIFLQITPSAEIINVSFNLVPAGAEFDEFPQV